MVQMNGRPHGANPFWCKTSGIPSRKCRKSVYITANIENCVPASKCFILLHYRGGQRFAGDSDSPISIVPHLKLTYMLILNEPYSIEKCATCLDTFLKF